MTNYLTSAPLLSIQCFLSLNIFILLLSIACVLEAKKKTGAKLWNDLLFGTMFYIFKTAIIAALLYRIWSPKPLLTIAIISYSLAVIIVLIVLWLVTKPLIKEMRVIMETKYICVYTCSMFAFWIYSKFIPLITLPTIKTAYLLYLFLFLYFPLLSYSMFYFFKLFNAYKKVGFVANPALLAGFGLIPGFFYPIVLFIESNLHVNFYYLFGWAVSVAFIITSYLHFAVEYPSLLNPKWKVYMPFDIVKVTAAMTLAFLALSLFFTVMEHG
ncbi:MAG: hypothetical protein ACXQTS_04800, partial [Candidatus Methanospirareceae archaeon]